MLGVGKSGFSVLGAGCVFCGANATDAGVGVPDGISRSSGPVPGELNAAAIDDEVNDFMVGNGYDPDKADEELPPLFAVRTSGRTRGGDEGLAVDLADVRDEETS